MQRERLDALVVCGNQYAGFEGAVLYMSGFEIVHRYVYVLFPLEGEPTLVFPREARWSATKPSPGSETRSGLTCQDNGWRTAAAGKNGSALEFTA